MKYKNIIFDFGNVLAEFGAEKVVGAYCPTLEDFGVIQKAVFYNWDEMDKGTIPYDAYVEHAISLVPERLRPALHGLFDDWYKQLTPMEDTWKFVRELKKEGFFVYILSNAPAFFAEHADYFEITKEFDGIVFSGPLKMAKPEPGIYQYLFDTYRLKPEECLFLDDKEENIVAAEKLGMDGIVFTGDIQSVRDRIK